MTSLQPSKLPPRLAWLAVALLGAIESLFGRNQYYGDWICYLNVSRAVSAFDLKAIFDPMWAPGYPILIAAVRALFPATALGEWYAICLLNWLIFLGLYAAWRYLLRQVVWVWDKEFGGIVNSPMFLWTSCAIFLAFGLSFDQPSRVSPDMLVTMLFVLALGQLVRLMRQPTTASAALLGVILAAGGWSKGIFVAFSAIFLFTLLLACLRRTLRWPILAVASAAFLVALAPFVLATSWSYGHFTLGVTGAMNYAFHVNHLPHWTNWQGGPPEAGVPLHPTQHLVQDLPVFGFAEPFHTTYPAYNNMAYFYDGYRHYFSLRNQLGAIRRNSLVFLWIVRFRPFVYALVVALLVVAFRSDWRKSFLRVLPSYWFLFLPACLGALTYLLVHLEGRYLSPFLLILSLLPALPLLDTQLASRRLLARILLVLLTLGTVAELGIREASTWVAALHRHDFRQDEPWRVSAAMPSFGLHKGDPVAVIVDNRLSTRCSWAYMAGVRIVAEFGSEALPLSPTERYSFDPPGPDEYQTDYVQVFRGLKPERRAQVLEAFHKEGALAAVSYAKPEENPSAGWQQVPGTDAWVYRFDR